MLIYKKNVKIKILESKLNAKNYLEIVKENTRLENFKFFIWIVFLVQFYFSFNEFKF